MSQLWQLSIKAAHHLACYVTTLTIGGTIVEIIRLQT